MLKSTAIVINGATFTPDEVVFTFTDVDGHRHVSRVMESGVEIDTVIDSVDDRGFKLNVAINE